MIKVVLVKRDEQDRSANSKDYWLEQRGETGSWQFKHCYILVGDKMITHTKHAPIVTIPAEELEELLNNDGQPLVFIDLPIKGGIDNKSAQIYSGQPLGRPPRLRKSLGT